jgi:hypothetical protein
VMNLQHKTNEGGGGWIHVAECCVDSSLPHLKHAVGRAGALSWNSSSFCRTCMAHIQGIPAGSYYFRQLNCLDEHIRGR